MALVKCYECSKEISDTAKACPHCGVSKPVECHECSKQIIKNLKVCPHCGASKQHISKKKKNWIIAIITQSAIVALLAIFFPELGSNNFKLVAILFFISDCLILFFQSRKISQKTKTNIRVITALIVFIPFAMIAGMPNSIEFYLIFIPLSLLFSIKTILLLNINNKNHTINNDDHFVTGLEKKRVAINIIYYLLIPVFMFFSFTTKAGKNVKICVDGDCENGYGRALYKISGKTSSEIEKFTGYVDTGGRISWYARPPISAIYIGKFKNGKMKGQGRIFKIDWMITDKEIYYSEGKFDGFEIDDGRWCKIISGAFIFKCPKYLEYELEELLKEFNIDKKGYLKKTID